MSRINKAQGSVIGHGIDVVDLNDFTRLLTPLTSNYLDRYFTKDELLAAGEGVSKLGRLAGRFAIKEAAMKALGRGWGNGVAYTDVEVVTLESGAPTIRLGGQLQSLEQALGIAGWAISSSHTSSMAVASVIALG